MLYTFHLLILAIASVTARKVAPLPPKRNITEVSDPFVLKTNQKNRALTFLGSFNNKFFYHGEEKVYWDVAFLACLDFGLKPAEFSSQDEINFVAALSPEGLSWTAGINTRFEPSSFIWHYSQELLSSSLELEYAQDFGLVLIIYSETKAMLRPWPVIFNASYLCYH